MSKRPRINIFLKLFYWLVKAIVHLSTRIYYGKVTILHKERLNINQPCILVANHPSTMMDPLNVARHMDRIVHFLANASLFESAIGNWFFNTFYCIPVARQKDKTVRKIDNQNSFQRAFDFLSKGGCLFVAPEGISTQEHNLNPLRTGTARIALGAENQNDFELDLIILPVGIYYEDAQRFRKRHLLNVGKPLSIHQYKNQYLADERGAVVDLTAELEKEMSDLLIITKDKEEDALFRMIEKVAIDPQSDSLENNFRKSKLLAQWLSNNPTSPTHTKASQLLDYLTAEKVSIESLGPTVAFSPLAILAGLLFPFGLLFNIIPAGIVHGLRKSLNLYPGYTSTVLILSGLFIFPLFYRLNNFWLSYWWDPGYTWPLTWMVYGLLGILSWQTGSQLKLLWQKDRFRQRMTKSAPAREALANYIQLKIELKEIITS